MEIELRRCRYEDLTKLREAVYNEIRRRDLEKENLIEQGLLVTEVSDEFVYYHYVDSIEEDPEDYDNEIVYILNFYTNKKYGSLCTMSDVVVDLDKAYKHLKLESPNVTYKYIDADDFTSYIDNAKIEYFLHSAERG